MKCRILAALLAAILVSGLSSRPALACGPFPDFLAKPARLNEKPGQPVRNAVKEVRTKVRACVVTAGFVSVLAVGGIVCGVAAIFQ